MVLRTATFHQPRRMRSREKARRHITNQRSVNYEGHCDVTKQKHTGQQLRLRSGFWWNERAPGLRGVGWAMRNRSAAKRPQFPTPWSSAPTREKTLIAYIQLVDRRRPNIGVLAPWQMQWAGVISSKTQEQGSHELKIPIEHSRR
jgi:hypothetical protein